jgi:hypothetical protein
MGKTSRFRHDRDAQMHAFFVARAKAWRKAITGVAISLGAARRLDLELDEYGCVVAPEESVGDESKR